MKLTVSLMVVISIGLSFLAYRQNQLEGRAQPQNQGIVTRVAAVQERAGRPKLNRQTMDIAKGSFVVDRSEPLAIRFTVSPNQVRDTAVVGGEFSSFSPIGNTIEVFLFDEDNYKNWRNRDEAQPLFQSRKSAEGEIRAAILEPGAYYLVFKNDVSFAESKTVNVDVKLEYED